MGSAEAKDEIYCRYECMHMAYISRQMSGFSYKEAWQ